ncbi:MAG: serine hydrolase domain-containing protein [Chloroflexota bacterium]
MFKKTRFSRLSVVFSLLVVLSTFTTAFRPSPFQSVKRPALDQAGGPTRPQDEQAALLPPPYDGPQHNPYTVLTSAISELENFEQSRELPRNVQEMISQSRRQAQAALEHFISLNADLKKMLDEIQKSVRMLGLARRFVSDRAMSDELQRQQETLAQAARMVAVGILDRAAAAGVDRLVIIKAQRFLAQGDLKVGQGQYGPAVKLFGDMLFTTNYLVFDINRFEQNIRDTFMPQTMGFAYAINFKGQLKRAGGYNTTRFLPDMVAPANNEYSEYNIASVSKIITTATALKIMQEKNISVDASISPYLPADWVQGAGIANLTFRDLFTHKSGLGGNQNGAYDFNSLRNYIAQGIQPADKGIYVYQNANLAMFRILIPMIVEPPCADCQPYTDEGIAATYSLIVRCEVLRPMGLTDPACASSPQLFPQQQYQLLAYKFPHDYATPGYAFGNWTLIAGGGGWYFSARQLAQFLAYLRYDNAILSPQTRATMNFGFLGWNPPDVWGWASGAFGTYYSHGGDLDMSNGGIDTCIQSYPNDIQAVLLINSVKAGNYPVYQCTALKNAYEDAWVSK